MISTDKGNRSWFPGLHGVRKRAQGNFLSPRLNLVLPSVVLPLNGQITFKPTGVPREVHSC